MQEAIDEIEYNVEELDDVIKRLNYIKEQKQLQDPNAQALAGMAGGGMNPYNEMMQVPDASNMPAEMNVPEMVGTAGNMRK